MSQAVSPSADRVYGLARVARCWDVSRATVCIATSRHRSCPNAAPVPWDLATTPLCWAHQTAIAESRFTGEGYRKIWARLRLCQHPQLTRTGATLDAGERPLGAAPDPQAGAGQAHDGTITTEAVDVMWGTDMTQTVTLAHVFVAVDHCNSECVGIHADKSANRFQALEPVRQGVGRHFGAIGKDVAAGLMLRHDHGSNYMSDDFQDEIAFLGIEASPSFVRQPEGNGVLLSKGPSARHELFYFGGPQLGAIRIDDFKFQFYQQPYGWPGEKVTTDMPTIVNIRQDPFERTPSIRGENLE